MTEEKMIFTYASIIDREIGSSFVHSRHGKCVVVGCEVCGIGYRLTLRKI